MLILKQSSHSKAPWQKLFVLMVVFTINDVNREEHPIVKSIFVGFVYVAVALQGVMGTRQVECLFKIGMLPY
ncbi:MAG: hypothetical protein ACFB2X_19380 [Rivularia sp. (in: cyanobacteria)]